MPPRGRKTQRDAEAEVVAEVVAATEDEPPQEQTQPTRPSKKAKKTATSSNSTQRNSQSKSSSNGNVDDERQSFIDFFPTLRAALLAELPPDIPTEAKDWYARVLDYNIVGGKMNRGLAVIDTYRSLVHGREVSAKEVHGCYTLGWCVELLQAFFLVADDVMDHSETRRGRPCWYKVENVGLIAVNDAFIIESCVFSLLRQHFAGQACYLPILELLHEVTHQTEVGQLLDLITAPEDRVNLNLFSMAKYKWIVKYKTAFYSFYLPVAMAMHYFGIKSKKAFDTARDILLPMGEYFQAQDDFLDCFGDPAVIGKIGTDIQDNKCSWLVNQALERASDKQLDLLHKSYGQNNPKSIAAVKKVFDDLKLRDVFAQYEEESHRTLVGMIDKVDESLLPRSMFTKFLNKIFKRTK